MLPLCFSVKSKPKKISSLKKKFQRNQRLHKIVKHRHFYHTITLVYIYFSHCGQKYLENTWGGTIRIYHNFVQGQGYPPECQRFAVHDEACRVVDVANLWHVGGFPCPCTKSWLIIFLLPLKIPMRKPLLLLSKTTSKRFLVRKRRQLGLIMMSRHCILYDVRRCSLKRSCLSRGRLRQVGKDSIVNSTGNAGKTLSEVGEKSVFRGSCKTASITSWGCYWHVVTLDRSVMTLRFEQLNKF